MTHPPPKQLVQFLKPYDPEIRKLALGVRELVLDVMAPCHENIYDAYSAVAMGYGPTDRLRDGICHVAVYSSHVNLGFNFGATLPDPKGILEGKGSQIRHISVADEEDLLRPEIRSYLQVACKIAVDDARKLGETLPPPPKKVVSIVKAIYPKKRRPDKSGKIIVIKSEGSVDRPTRAKRKVSRPKKRT
ncbi:MAG TPA: DUF1801 domain-containing protein [Pyrinomonadaceae bacterium]|nr:DUF1801 domain-containing protein [Pyrinomonadaceae bacterium]